MDDLALLPGDWPPPPHDAQAQTMALADQALRTLGVFRALLASGRRVDVNGLDRCVGLLCAKALDLPPDQGRAVRTSLVQLAAELDALGLAMGAPA